MTSRFGVVLALLVASSAAIADEELSELLIRNWSINMNKCKAWPLFWNGSRICLMGENGATTERPMSHLSNADSAFLKRHRLPSLATFDLCAATNDVSMAIDRYTILLQTAQSNHAEGTARTTGTTTVLVPERRGHRWSGETNTVSKGTGGRLPPQDNKRRQGEAWQVAGIVDTSQQSTIAVNVKEVEKLKLVLRDLENKKKALILFGRTNPGFFRSERPGGAAAILRELNGLLQQQLITKEEYHERRKKVVDSVGEQP